MKIINAYLHETQDYNGEVIQGEFHENKVELENGVWLTNMMDGRYHSSDDENECWGEVFKDGQFYGFGRLN